MKVLYSITRGLPEFSLTDPTVRMPDDNKNLSKLFSKLSIVVPNYLKRVILCRNVSTNRRLIKIFLNSPDKAARVLSEFHLAKQKLPGNSQTVTSFVKIFYMRGKIFVNIIANWMVVHMPENLISK